MRRPGKDNRFTRSVFLNKVTVLGGFSIVPVLYTIDSGVTSGEST